MKQASGGKAYIDKTNLPPQLIDVQGETLVDGFGNFWTVLNIGAYDDGTPSSSYKTQLLVPYGHGLTDTDIFIRTADKDYTDQDNPAAFWRNTRRLLHDGNYIPYIFTADENGYCGIRMPVFGRSEWLRTPLSGLLPYEAGGIDDPHSCVGTESWCFHESHIQKMYGKTLDLDRDATANSVYIGKNAGCRVSHQRLSNDFCRLILTSGMPGGQSSNNPVFLDDADFSAYTDNTLNLGLPSFRWKQVYAVNTAISTSDRNEKKEISYIGSKSSYEDTIMTDEQLTQLILGLKPVVFKRINGESGRPHHGFIAQDFEELLKDIGLYDHAAFIKSPKIRELETEKEVEKEVIKEDGTKDIVKETIKEVHQEEIPGEYTRGLRYEEFIPDIARFEQILYQQNQEQQKKIENLEEQLKEALNRIAILEGTRN